MPLRAQGKVLWVQRPGFSPQRGRWCALRTARHECAMPTTRSTTLHCAPHVLLPARDGAPRKPRQHLVYLSVHLSRPCWIGGKPLISMIGLSHDEDTFCLYAAPLLVKSRPIE